MRIFVTGASGFVGSAVVPELLRAGHQVVGLARSDASASAVKTVGAEVTLGDLADLDVLKRGASSADGVIHLGFIHDFASFAKSAETDRAAIQTLATALAGSNRPLVVTSGTLGAGAPGTIGTEDDPGDATRRFSESALDAAHNHRLRRSDTIARRCGRHSSARSGQRRPWDRTTRSHRRWRPSVHSFKEAGCL
jgi:nucleoside-diphosphate-sugar epimerase